MRAFGARASGSSWPIRCRAPWTASVAASTRDGMAELLSPGAAPSGRDEDVAQRDRRRRRPPPDVVRKRNDVRVVVVPEVMTVHSAASLARLRKTTLTSPPGTLTVSSTQNASRTAWRYRTAAAPRAGRRPARDDDSYARLLVPFIVGADDALDDRVAGHVAPRPCAPWPSPPRPLRISRGPAPGPEVARVAQVVLRRVAGDPRPWSPCPCA